MPRVAKRDVKEVCMANKLKSLQRLEASLFDYRPSFYFYVLSFPFSYGIEHQSYAPTGVHRLDDQVHLLP